MGAVEKPLPPLFAPLQPWMMLGDQGAELTSVGLVGRVGSG